MVFKCPKSSLDLVNLFITFLITLNQVQLNHATSRSATEVNATIYSKFSFSTANGESNVSLGAKSIVDRNRVKIDSNRLQSTVDFSRTERKREFQPLQIHQSKVGYVQPEVRLENADEFSSVNETKNNQEIKWANSSINKRMIANYRKSPPNAELASSSGLESKTKNRTKSKRSEEEANCENEVKSGELFLFIVFSIITGFVFGLLFGMMCFKKLPNLQFKSISTLRHDKNTESIKGIKPLKTFESSQSIHVNQ